MLQPDYTSYKHQPISDLMTHLTIILQFFSVSLFFQFKYKATTIS